MNAIDLNCDMGESFGSWRMGNDAAIMDHVSSVNIACGFHAGDPGTMRRTIKLALDKGLAVGAHPSYPDLEGFGRREMMLSPEEIYDTVLYQVAASKGVCESLGGKLHHVKPHGALYNRAAKDKSAAAAIAKAVRSIDDKLILYGLSGSSLISQGSETGLNTASEAFADRTYMSDGSLTPRNRSDALITDEDEAVKQVLQMLREKSVTAVSGESVEVEAQTICIHGDGKDAPGFARAIARGLEEHGVSIERPGR